MDSPVFRKQLSIFLPVDDWKAVRLEAARRRIPMTALCREWLEPALDHLRRYPPSPNSDDACDPDQLPSSHHVFKEYQP